MVDDLENEEFAFSDSHFSVKIGQRMHVSIYRHIRNWLIDEISELEFDANNSKEMDMLTIETEAWRIADIIRERCEKRASEILSNWAMLPELFAESSLGEVVREALLDNDQGALAEVKSEYPSDGLNTLIMQAWLGPVARG